MNTESNRIARELAATIEGEAWYGSSLREILADLDAERAQARPVPDAHSIWEIAAHLDAWINFYIRAVDGVPIPPWPSMPAEMDWPPAGHGEDEWRACLDSLFEHHAALVDKMNRFEDERLESAVPGRTYEFRRMFQSASLHAAYHSGQIALLKKMMK